MSERQRQFEAQIVDVHYADLLAQWFSHHPNPHRVPHVEYIATVGAGAVRASFVESCND